MRFIFRLCVLGLSIVCFSCSKTSDVPPQENTAHQQWTYNLGIYEVNVRQYTPEGTFAAFAQHLPRLKEMGVGILWFMPIHPIGQMNRKGSLGSYYSVRDYKAVNPEFGTLEEFKGLVRTIHSMGMFVMMDWVANHTAWDNVLTIEHPEWYVQVNGRFINPPGTNWTDVIQLDYSKLGLREYMIEAMKFWVVEVGVDGFRCDAAHLVPHDFWRQARNRLSEVRPDVFMLAESDGPSFHYNGFDMTYVWALTGWGDGIFRGIAGGTRTALALHAFVNQESTSYPQWAYRMLFTSNHDLNSWVGTEFELYGAAAEVFAVATLTLDGMPLIYSGQEAGFNRRLQFFEKDQIDWQQHHLGEVYLTLLRLKRNNRALWNGEMGGEVERITTSHDNAVFAFVRRKESQKVFVVLNLSPGQLRVTFAGTLQLGNYHDTFTGQPSEINTTAALSLQPWSYRVLSQ